MRRLIRVLIFIAIAWSAYWFIAGYGLRTALTGWFDKQQELGWQADFSDVETAGYPSHHMTRLLNPALADPVNGTAWSADWIEFQSPAIWPGRQVLHFADTPQRLSYFDQTATIQADALQAELQLQPGVALVLGKDGADIRCLVGHRRWRSTSRGRNPGHDHGADGGSRSLCHFRPDRRVHARRRPAQSHAVCHHSAAGVRDAGTGHDRDL